MRAVVLVLTQSFESVRRTGRLRMPPGVGCATVLEPLNAALMAAKIFAVTDHDIAELVKSYQESQRVRILEADLEVSG